MTLSICSTKAHLHVLNSATREVHQHCDVQHGAGALWVLTLTHLMLQWGTGSPDEHRDRIRYPEQVHCLLGARSGGDRCAV